MDTTATSNRISRILCLGNNSEDTDHRARDLARSRSLQCHGLLSELQYPVTFEHYEKPGVYHTSVLDVDPARLRILAQNFDEVVLLSQPHHAWSHPNVLLATLEVMRDLTVPCFYQDLEIQQQLQSWQQLLQDNTSICIFPWINLSISRGHTTVCCRSEQPVSTLTTSWQPETDVNLKKIRDSMQLGQPLSDHCGSCYQREHQGMISARQQQTIIWAQRLNIKDVHSLKEFASPVSYDIRVGDICNLMCRMCGPTNSHLIHREYHQLGLIGEPRKTIRQDPFQWVDINQAHRVYVTGGEPTISPEFLQWLQRCIDNGRTDIEILINTNAHQFKPKFLELATAFSNMQFIVSMDAWETLNDYIRWPSHWNNIANNCDYLIDRGHRLNINVTVSIYNVSRLSELFWGLSERWPQVSVSADIVSNPSYLSPTLWPHRDQVLRDLRYAMDSQCVKNNPSLTSLLQSLKLHFEKSNGSNPEALTRFFNFNDRLDLSRGINLKDYIPDLYQYRIQG